MDLMTLGMGPKVAYFLQYTASFVLGLVIAFVHGWQLTLVVLAVVPFLMISGAAYAKAMAEGTLASQAAYAKAGGVAQEVLSLISAVAAFGSEEQEALRYESHLRRAATIAKRRALVTTAAMTVTFPFPLVGGQDAGTGGPIGLWKVHCRGTDPPLLLPVWRLGGRRWASRVSRARWLTFAVRWLWCRRSQSSFR